MAYIFFNQKIKEKLDFEIVELKGSGHPDSLADSLADKISNEYSKYTLSKFGAILHHNFDKLGILGGSSYVKFGKGYLVNPIRVLINGRASFKFSRNQIPVEPLIRRWVYDFFEVKFPKMGLREKIGFNFNLSTNSSPGHSREKVAEKGTRKHWFQPRGLEDLQELKRLVSNDTSLGVGYAPFSKLELFVKNIESYFNSPVFKKVNKWIGSDIKILGCRKKDKYFVTLCIPQIANHVKNLDQYKKNLNKAKKSITKIKNKFGINKCEIYINTRDNYKLSELYLTAIGSSIESGDEGLVGRGNRVNGIISPTKPMSMEGSAGKNPVYHIGKIYYIAAQKLSNKIHSEFKVYNEVFLVSQSGRDLIDPWICSINLYGKVDLKKLNIIAGNELRNIPTLTKKIIEGKKII